MKKIIGILCLLSIMSYFQLFAYAQDDVKAKIKAMKPKDFPTQSIEFVVVYEAGGGMDVTARLLGKYVEKYIDTRIVIVNKTGGGGLIGHAYLATQAKNDGYTVGILADSYWTDALLRSQGKWSYKDMEALGFINVEPRNWVVSTTGPLKDKSLKEVIELAKQKPETLKVNITPGMSSQFMAEMVEMASGTKFIKVPYQGGRPGVIAMLGGHIDIAQAYLPEFRGNLEAGQVKAIAAAGKERLGYLPDVPTFNEVLKVDSVLAQSWRWAAVPKGTPRDRFRYLEAAIEAALRDPDCIKEFDKMGLKVGDKVMNAKQTAEEIEILYKIDREFFAKTGRLPK